MNAESNLLAISSKNASAFKRISFDKFKADGSTVLNETTFDFNTTKFVDEELEAGTVRVYDRYGDFYN